MKRKEFCCNANKDFYEQYYANQSGSGIPVFYGALGQRGHGLGSMISGIGNSDRFYRLRKSLQFRHNYSPINKSDKISLVCAILYIRDELRGKQKKSSNKSRARVLLRSFSLSDCAHFALSCRSQYSGRAILISH